MSFLSLRNTESIQDRRSYFWKILLSGLDNYDDEDLKSIDWTNGLLDCFQIGLLTYPFRDDEHNGDTILFKTIRHAPKEAVARYLYSGGEEDYENHMAFSSTGSLMEFLTDYFGLIESASYHKIRIKYRDGFPFRDFPRRAIDDFAVMALRSARIILKNPLIFESPSIYVKIRPEWNAVEVIDGKARREITLARSNFF